MCDSGNRVYAAMYVDGRVGGDAPYEAMYKDANFFFIKTTCPTLLLVSILYNRALVCTVQVAIVSAEFRDL